jgi:agmatine deiminase
MTSDPNDLRPYYPTATGFWGKLFQAAAMFRQSTNALRKKTRVMPRGRRSRPSGLPARLCAAVLGGFAIGLFACSSTKSVNPEADGTHDVLTVAEFEPQEFIWLTWSNERSLGGPAIGDTILDLVETLVGHVKIRVHVFSEAASKDFKSRLAERGLGGGQVEVFVYPNAPGMIRDFGPCFVRRSDGSLGVVDFNWSNGGVRSAGHPRTLAGERLDREWADTFGIPVVSRSEMVSEGGAREVNGRGTLLLAESVELQRNPGWSKAKIESEYRHHLGSKNIIWMKSGLYEEEMLLLLPGGCYSAGTGGHVDTFVRFVNPTTILLAEVTAEERDSNPIAAESYARMEENARILRAATDQDGRPFRVVRVPAADPMQGEIAWEDLGAERVLFPDAPEGESVRYFLGTSYLNYIVANDVVVVPKFWRLGGAESTRIKDARVLEIFREVFPPSYRIVQVDMVDFSHSGGGFHCGSLHQPSVK